MEKMESMQEEMQKKLEMFEPMCNCRACPTYTAHGKTEPIVFCHPMRGLNESITSENGCTCGTCPVYDQMKYMTTYFCTRDIEMKQKAIIAEAAWKGHSVWDHLTGRKTP